MISALINWMVTLVSTFGQKILSLLPLSPFRTFIDNFTPPAYISWLNWFFPVTQILQVMAVWLSAIALFYLYSIIMRWIKMIGD